MNLDLYIDGKKVSKENIESIQITKDLVVCVVLKYEDKKERIFTDNTLRKIELKHGNSK